MRTIKLVIVGDSHTGKTSLRTQYITGRFSTGYRATIGADFYSKNLPHYRDASEQISLQIWDTAGQERFSALSRAFFRGADAVLLVFDANSPASLHNLRKWWQTFCDYAPVPEDETSGFCTIFVGNKVDLLATTQAAGKPVVTQQDVETFVDTLFPGRDMPLEVQSQPASPVTAPSESAEPVTPPEPEPAPRTWVDEVTNPLSSTESIEIKPPNSSLVSMGYGIPRFGGKPVPGGSRATSRSRWAGTMTSARTGISVYHTPSSSLFNASSAHMSAPASPPSPFGSPRPTHSRKRTSHSRLQSDATVTPGNHGDDSGRPESDSSEIEEPPDTATLRPSAQQTALINSRRRRTHFEPDEGPRLFWTSAKTGESVSDIFDYVARRVVMRAEWDETHIRDSLTVSEADSELTVRLRPSQTTGRFGCCA